MPRRTLGRRPGGRASTAGVGAAIVTPLTLTLISEAFPANERAAALGIWGDVHVPTVIHIAALARIGKALILASGQRDDQAAS